MGSVIRTVATVALVAACAAAACAAAGCAAAGCAAGGCAAGGCAATTDDAVDAGHAGARWESAHARFEASRQIGTDIGVYDAWETLDPASEGGREAHRRLREADRHYREGIRRLADPEAEDPGAALARGLALAPMDPDLYLPLARACRDRGLTARAKEYYRKYLLARPTGRSVDAARREMAELPADPLDLAMLPHRRGDERDDELDTDAGPDTAPDTTILSALDAPLGAAVALVALVALVAFATTRRRGSALAPLARKNPELHPAIAYLVGSLRHELLKHRIGAVQDAVQAIGRGDPSRDQVAFLRARLFGGEPLDRAWRGHVESFERALGYRLDLRRDRAFRQAGRAIRRLAALEGKLTQQSPRTAARLATAHATLRGFDRDLARLVGTLVRTSVDAALLDEVVAAVRSEYAPSQIELDSLEIIPSDEPVAVEVFRVDLVLILKNVVRNAILAVGRGPAPRRLRIAVSLELEPTGEEAVMIRVSDTSEEALSQRVIHDRRVDRGLGLVTAALARYNGAIDVEPDAPPFVKAVVVRFFRALDPSVRD
jgi:hypothetical protein